MKINKMVIFFGIGIELVAIMIVCLYGGLWIDEKYGTNGLGVGLLPMLGLAGWIYRVVLLTKRMEKNEDKG